MKQEQTPSPISSDRNTLQESSPAKRSGFLARLLQEFLALFDKPASVIDEFFYKVQHIAETNFQIAQRMSDLGKHKDAIFRLKIVLWRVPDHQQAHYLLGCSYMALAEMEKAKPYLHKAMELNPDDEEALFMYATLEPDALPLERQPVTMPQAIALDYFDGQAAHYETSQLDAGYRAHQLLDEAVWDALDRRRTNYSVLELGCGTGLCGSLLAEHAEDIVGVDFSLPMLDIAKTKRRPDLRRVYTETMHQDLRVFVQSLDREEYDAVVAAHVFNYVGEINMVIANVIHGIKPGGVFVFQVERYDVEGRFGLIPGLGRFGHSDGYIRHYLEQVGFHIVENNVVQVYPDYQLVQYVARKPSYE